MTNENLSKLKRMGNADKVDEFLFKAWERLEKRDIKNGISLYHSAIVDYGGKYNVVRKDLESAKKEGLLPENFEVPENQEDFIKFFEDKYLKK